MDMALQIANDSQPFGPLSGAGPNSLIKSVTMPASVSQAAAILTGVIAEFSQGNDHHLGQLDVQVQVVPSTTPSTNVQVRVTLGLRDWSGNWDDQYDGTVFFAVLGE
jgi:hypothetical protein